MRNVELLTAALGLVACACSVHTDARPPVNIRPMPTQIVDTSGLVPPRETAPEVSERRARGQILEALEIPTFEGTYLPYSVLLHGDGSTKLHIFSDLTSHILYFNPKQLNSITNNCGLNQISKDVQLIITDRPGEEDALSLGSIIGIWLNMASIYREIDSVLENHIEVVPTQLPLVREKLAVVYLNRGVAHSICVAAEFYQLTLGGLDEESAIRIADESTYIADTYADLLFNGHVQPIVTFDRIT